MPLAPAPPMHSVEAAAARAAALILDAFLDYNGRFSDVTRRARRHFEQRDWRQAQVDAALRIDLYDLCIGETLGRLQLLLDDRVRSRALWSATRDAYAARVGGMRDRELAKTFFNTLSRRFFHTRGVDCAIEFVALDLDPLAGAAAPALDVHELDGELVAACARLIGEPGFGRLADPVGDAQALARELAERAIETGAAPRRVELLRATFHRERRAYRVGRLVDAHGDASPWVLAFTSGSAGVRADALLTNVGQVAQLFGWSRSYFQADIEDVTAAVGFLHALLPHKPVGEIYTVLGRARQGKTERCRSLFRHLALHPEDRFVRAEGERGMVMAVFTPLAFPVVIKLIRDAFAYPKDAGRRDVEAKYRQVFRHDRIGRLVDAQEFRALGLPLAQFEPDLLAELRRECAGSIEIEGGQLVVSHCYVQRRLRPLDLYVRENPFETSLRAVLDYGQAIKDLARSNIFPGDLLLKNFGVSRIGRVVFYDYDELGLVEEYRFRRLPEAREEDVTRPLEDWLSVRAQDVFPEQFVHYLGLRPELREALLVAHPELFDPDWWNSLRAALARGELADVPPYPSAARLATRSAPDAGGAAAGAAPPAHAITPAGDRGGP